MKTALPPDTTITAASAPADRSPRAGAPSALASPVVRGALVVAALIVVAAAVMGSHLQHGGLYTDDWAYTAIQHNAGTFGLFKALFASNRERPVGELYLALTTAVSGTDPQLHALWGVLTLLLAAGSLYLLLRLLSLSVGEALPIVLLLMVFPFADSGWLWYTASYIYLAIAMAALGGALALAGLRAEGRRWLVWHLGALLLFAASILIYQTAAGLICLSIFAYLGRTTRRRAIALWALDVCTVALAATLPWLITGSSGTNADPVIPLGEQIDHAKLMVNQGATVLMATLVPFGGAHRNVVLPVAFAIVVLAVAIARRAQPGSELRTRLQRLLVLLVAACVVIAAAYAAYVPAPIHLYQPLGKGEENRVNVLASLGYAMIVYALAATLATCVVSLLRRPLRWAPLLALGAVAVVFVGYVQRTRSDIHAWDRAGVIQRQELQALRAIGRLPSGTTLYTFGGTGTTAPDVYAFRVTWDLDGAYQILWNDFTLNAYPIFAGTEMHCDATEVVPIGPGNGNSAFQAASYGKAVFYDFRTGREQRITSAVACAHAIGHFTPEPAET